MNDRIFKILQYLKDRSAEKHMPHTPDQFRMMGNAYNYAIEYIYNELLDDSEQELYCKMQANPTCDCCGYDIHEYHKRIEDQLLEHLPWKSPKQNSSA